MDDTTILPEATAPAVLKQQNENWRRCRAN